MKQPALILLLGIALTTHAQTDSIIIPATRPFAKNQFSVNFNLLRFVSDNGPYLRLDYRRLKSSVQEDDRHIASKYYAFSTDIFGSVNSKVTFKEATLIEIGDTTVWQRLSGSLSGGVSVRGGIERQRRLLFAAGDWGGLQGHAGWYGLLGYSSELEQYIHVQQVTGQVFKDDFVDWENDYAIAGERKSDYLRLGVGAVLGLDAVISNPRFTIAFGLTFGFINLNADFPVHTRILSDPDNHYTEAVRWRRAYPIPDMGVRIGIAF